MTRKGTKFTKKHENDVCSVISEDVVIARKLKQALMNAYYNYEIDQQPFDCVPRELIEAEAEMKIWK